MGKEKEESLTKSELAPDAEDYAEKIPLATVWGDEHGIGKNIVGLKVDDTFQTALIYNQPGFVYSSEMRGTKDWMCF